MGMDASRAPAQPRIHKGDLQVPGGFEGHHVGRCHVTATPKLGDRVPALKPRHPLSGALEAPLALELDDRVAELNLTTIRANSPFGCG
jgi:hypothetical protein